MAVVAMFLDVLLDFFGWVENGPLELKHGKSFDQILIGSLLLLGMVGTYLDVPGRKLGSMVCKWAITAITYF